jgi:hypothetical protein
LFLNQTRIDELYGRERFLLSPRKYIYEARAVLDGASGAFDPEDLQSRKAYLAQLDRTSKIPSRAFMYNTKLNFERGVETMVLTMDSAREKDQEIGRNYTYGTIPHGQCFISSHRKPDRDQLQEEVPLPDIAYLQFPITHLLNSVIENYNNGVDEDR